MPLEFFFSYFRSYGVLLESEGVCFRGLFIIDGAGKIRQMTVNDFPVGRAVDETLRLIQVRALVMKQS